MPHSDPVIPSLEPSYTFLRYVVESDVVYSPDHIHAESRHRRIWEFYCNDDVLKARRLAFRCFKKEATRFAEINKQFPEGGLPLQGLKLYCIFIQDHDSDELQHFLHDGKYASSSELLKRREMELVYLMDAGIECLAFEAQGDDGRRFWVYKPNQCGVN